MNKMISQKNGLTGPRVVFARIACSLLGVFVFCFSSLAQEKTKTKPDAPAPFEIQYAPGEEKVWEFGLRLACESGTAKKIVVSFPVPLDWPEQSVELFEETKTDNVCLLYTSDAADE